MNDRRLSADHREFDPEGDCEDVSSLLQLGDALDLLSSPDTGNILSPSTRGDTLDADGESFPFLDGLPLLYPKVAHPFFGPKGLDLPFDRYENPLLQYLLISSIKQTHSFPNTEHTNIWYLRHMHRARVLLRSCRGIALDVGCEDPETSRLLFPSGVRYLGLDPLPFGGGPFRILGIAEFLPLRSGSLDAVAFLTSLDHVFDYHRAIDEAWRVLKPGGSIYVASLLWSDRADLLSDHYHFHHFRDYELYGALRRFAIVEREQYPWKDDAHRYGVYLRAIKR